MQRRSILPVRPGGGRSAFTLVELLAVIAIIAVLVALSAAAVIKYLGAQQINVTQQKVNTVASQLKKQWATVTQNAMNDPQSKYPAAVLQWATVPGMAVDAKRAQAIYVKCVLKQTFPMSFAEALNPWPMPPLPSYQKYLTNLGITGSPNPPANYESAACLLMTLQRGPSGMGLNAEDLGVSSTSEFPAGNGTVKALVDAWGNPLIFCRWPTGSPVLNPGGPQAGIGNDPGDPQGLLASTAWRNAGQNLANFQANLHQLPGTTGQSFKLAPLVGSYGPDKLPGMNWYTWAPDGTGADNDNIYNTN